MNATITNFGYPATLVHDYRHWVVMLRPAQPTLGALVLAAKSDATAFGSLSPDAHAELSIITAHIEQTLTAAVAYEKINYLMLMMVDPHVHFHVIPRYDGTRTRRGVDFADVGWPKVPALAEALVLNDAQIADMIAWLKGYWPN
jgi:diadenosine tetraphosphate (Ap4A) HIT family hydrolase